MATWEVPERGGSDPSPRREVIGSGPVLILHLDCDGCRQLADTTEGQFTAHGVVVERKKIEIALKCDLAVFPGVVILVHHAAEVTPTVLRTISNVIEEYRQVKENGLRWLLAGDQRRFHEAGVLQLVLPQAALDHRCWPRRCPRCVCDTVPTVPKRRST